MIVLLVQEGQMCNQLLSLSALYSLGLKHGCDVTCPVLTDVIKDNFIINPSVDGIRVKFYSNFFSKYVSIGIKVIKKITKCSFEKQYDPSKVGIQLFLNWLSFLESDAYVAFAEQIRECFQIRTDVYSHCAENYNNLKSGDIVVGVHIRRGDYKEHNGGIWYYDDLQYIEWMKHLVYISKNKSIQFFLCSNEEIDLKMYMSEGLDVVVPGKSSLEDLSYLSLCDYVMGPPSTYSFWAAMYGNKKRCILDNASKQYEWEDFLYFEDRIKKGDVIR